MGTLSSRRSAGRTRPHPGRNQAGGAALGDSWAPSARACCPAARARTPGKAALPEGNHSLRTRGAHARVPVGSRPSGSPQSPQQTRGQGQHFPSSSELMLFFPSLSFSFLFSTFFLFFIFFFPVTCIELYPFLCPALLRNSIVRLTFLTFQVFLSAFSPSPNQHLYWHNY